MNWLQLALVLHALGGIVAMYFIVPALTLALGPHTGFLAALACYWLGFCLPVIALHIWRRHDGHLFSEKLPWRDWWVPALLLLQVAIVTLIIFVPHTAMLTTRGAALAAAVGIVNAGLAEAAWRGGFLTSFANRPRLGFWLGWLLFTGWHGTLLLSHGLIFPGGAPVIIGGAALLGLLWSWIVWRTGSVFYVTIAHALTATVALWLLFDSNGFVPPHYQP